MAPSTRLDDIKLEDIDFDKVAECRDKEVLKRYLKLLEDDGCYYVELMNACKDKLLEVSPKEYYLLYPRVASFQEVDDATKDLLDWQESVKATDDALRKERKNRIWDDEHSTVSVPIRGQEAVVARPNVRSSEPVRKIKNQPEEKHDAYARDKTRMKDYYDTWDRIDVDALEAEMDAEEKEEEERRRKHFDELKEEQEEAHSFTPIDVGKLPEGVPAAHRKHMADSEKEKGNEAFYAKDFEEADAYYTRSLHFKADDPSTWSNRALARLKLDNAQGALQDCEHALALNPKYMKALHRKGKALYDLQRYDEAVHAFQLALVESPGNTQINGDLMVARRKQKAPPASSPPASFAPPARARPPKPDDESTCIIEDITEEASAPPRTGYTRVQIEEDSDSEEEDGGASAVGTGAASGFHKVQIQEVSDDEEDEHIPVVPAKKLPDTVPVSGFHKVQIQEADEDSEEAEPMPEPVTAPITAAAANAGTAGAAGFHKVQIVEASDSEDEESSLRKAAGAPVSTSPVGEASSGVCFDDMD